MACLFGYIGEPAPGLMKRMAALLGHRYARGWERAGMDIRDGLTIAIGHGMPAWAKENQVAAVPERRLAFGYTGVLFNPPVETDVAEHLMNHFRDAPEKMTDLEGAFAAALLRGEELTLIRDPSGIKVLYWARTPKRFVFASEIKALFADPDIPRTLRMGALPEYFTFSFIPGEGTMFEGIHELQPGTILTCRNGSVDRRRYFMFENAEWQETDRREEADYIRRVRTDLETSVAECCSVQPDPPAVFVSGGIDSSAVLALAARRYPDRRLRTFSVHFGPKYASENEFVSMMVDQYRTDHTWLTIRPDRFLKRLRDIIWTLDDPIGDPITVPNFLMAEAASAVTGVVLNGEGGDPCFGGPKNIPMMLSRIYGPLPDDPPEAWLEYHYLLSYRKCFADLSRLLSPEVLRESGGEPALTELIRPFLTAERPKHFLNKLMSINIRLKGANLILVKVDKMTSANGILALAPLFSKRIVETSMACPPGMKLRGNVEKGVLKQAVADVVPAPIVRRPKSGMMVPVRFWLQGEMRRYARRVLSRRNLRRVGFFDVEYVRKIFAYDRDDVQGSRHGLKLWMLITFMLWYEQMVEGKR